MSSREKGRRGGLVSALLSGAAALLAGFAALTATADAPLAAAALRIDVTPVPLDPGDPSRIVHRAAPVHGRAVAARRRPALRRALGPARERRRGATGRGVRLRERSHGPSDLRRGRPPRRASPAPSSSRSRTPEAAPWRPTRSTPRAWSRLPEATWRSGSKAAGGSRPTVPVSTGPARPLVAPAALAECGRNGGLELMSGRRRRQAAARVRGAARAFEQRSRLDRPGRGLAGARLPAQLRRRLGRRAVSAHGRRAPSERGPAGSRAALPAARRPPRAPGAGLARRRGPARAPRDRAPRAAADARQLRGRGGPSGRPRPHARLPALGRQQLRQDGRRANRSARCCCCSSWQALSRRGPSARFAGLGVQPSRFIFSCSVVGRTPRLAARRWFRRSPAGLLDQATLVGVQEIPERHAPPPDRTPVLPWERRARAKRFRET